MDTQTIIDTVQTYLADKGVYRTDAFILESINDGYKLTAVLTLFDERRGSVSIGETRNFVSLPVSSTAEMIAPVYVANTTTGVRVNPVRLDEFEFYSTLWEGDVDDVDATQYTVLAPYAHSMCNMCVVPIPSGGSVDLTVMGAFVPATLDLTDEPRLSENFQDILFHYGVFHGFASEPGRAKDSMEAYKMFVNRVNELVATTKSRFPSGQGFKPRPVEFMVDNVKRSQQKTVESQQQRQDGETRR